MISRSHLPGFNPTQATIVNKAIVDPSDYRSIIRLNLLNIRNTYLACPGGNLWNFYAYALLKDQNLWREKKPEGLAPSQLKTPVNKTKSGSLLAKQVAAETRFRLTEEQVEELAEVKVETLLANGLRFSFGSNKTINTELFAKKFAQELNTRYNAGEHQPQWAFDVWRDEKLQITPFKNAGERPGFGIDIANFRNFRTAQWDFIIDSANYLSGRLAFSHLERTAFKIIAKAVEELKRGHQKELDKFEEGRAEEKRKREAEKAAIDILG